MQDHRFEFVVDGTPEEVWDVMAAQSRTNVDRGSVQIEILHPGDADGNGLVRHCHFPVPKYLLTGGAAESWEWITEAVRPVSWRYDTVSKPLWSKSTGWTRLEGVGSGQTRVSFRETYEAFNPLSRIFLEKPVHTFISKDNDRLIEAALVHALQQRRAGHESPAPKGP
jgi:hypothetical protein